MKCPACGFVSFDDLEQCKKCRVDLAEHRSRFGLGPRLVPKRPSQDLSIPTASAPTKRELDPGFELDGPDPEAPENRFSAAAEKPLPLFASDEIGELPDLRRAWENPLPGERTAAPLPDEPSVSLDIEEARWEGPREPTASLPEFLSEPQESSGDLAGMEPAPSSDRHSPMPVSADPHQGGREKPGRKFPRAPEPGEASPLPPVPPFTLLAAGLIDLALMAVVFGAFLLAGNLLLGRPEPLRPDPNLLRQLAAPYFLVFFVLGFGYFTLLHYLTGQTVGKMLCRIRVEGLGGEAPQLAQAFLRSVGGLVCWLLLGVGFAGIFIGLRGWNDRLAGTRVVAAEPPASPESFPRETPPPTAADSTRARNSETA